MSRSLKPLVSIIIPVFNAEGTISKTLKSLLDQNYENLELIFINDCSTDQSLDVILGCKEDFEKKGYKIQIHTLNQNSGVAVARNIGLDAATGEYIYYVDADDFITNDAISLLVSTLQEHEADIVGCDWYLSFEQNARYMKQPQYSHPMEAINYMLGGIMRWNLWIFMVRRDLYERNGIRFIPGMNMGEDMLVTMKLFAYAKKVIHLDKGLYYYAQGNTNSLTKTYSEKHIEEVTTNVKKLKDFFDSMGFDKEANESLMFLKLNIKLPLLISDKVSNYVKWRSWFIEANSFIFKNPYIPVRTKIIQYAALQKQYWFLKMYYFLIIRVVYGIIYK